MPEGITKAEVNNVSVRESLLRIYKPQLNTSNSGCEVTNMDKSTGAQDVRKILKLAAAVTKDRS